MLPLLSQTTLCPFGPLRQANATLVCAAYGVGGKWETDGANGSSCHILPCGGVQCTSRAYFWGHKVRVLCLSPNIAVDKFLFGTEASQGLARLREYDVHTTFSS